MADVRRRNVKNARMTDGSHVVSFKLIFHRSTVFNHIVCKQYNNFDTTQAYETLQNLSTFVVGDANWNASGHVPLHPTILPEVYPRHFSLHTFTPVGSLFRAQEVKLIKSGTTPSACPKLFETNVPNIAAVSRVKKGLSNSTIFLGAKEIFVWVLNVVDHNLKPLHVHVLFNGTVRIRMTWQPLDIRSGATTRK